MADATTIAQLRANIADTSDPPMLTDEQLGAELDRVNGDELAARVNVLRQLLAEFAKQVDYATAASSVKASQRFAQVRQLFEDAKNELAQRTASGAAGTSGPPRLSQSVRVTAGW